MAQVDAPNAYERQESRVTATSSQSKAARIRRSVSQNIAGFFGVAEESDRRANKWENRRKRYASSIGKLKDDYMPSKDGSDEVDAGPSIRDPLRIPHRAPSGSGQALPMRRKSSVAYLAYQGIGNLVGSRMKLRQQTHRQGSQATDSTHGEEFSLVDDVFYDEKTGAARLPDPPKRPGVNAELQSTPAPGWRRKPPPPLPDTPGTDVVDQPDFGLGRIKDKVLDSALRRDKRVIGVGVVGRFFRPSIHTQAFTKDVKQQLDEMDDHRPYFTYWATFVQIVVFIVAVSVYGTAPFGVGTHTENRMIVLSNLAREVKSFGEKENVWFGPRQSDLIHLGAKYSPCMRVDLNLRASLNLDRAEENASACCVRNDGGGCVQRVKSQCGSLSSWKKWDKAVPGPGGRLSGTVCGQDPSYCITPASAEPFKWPDAIVDWPVCTNTRKPNASLRSKTDRHMSCEILGRPCCHGIQGECFITTREHCDLIRGRFHTDKFLCSQTECFEEICGMIPFANDGTPDQFYRLWTSLFLHGGLVHLFVTIIFQMWIMRDMEKLVGAIRMAIIYIGSGIAGNLASCTFLPYHVEAGPSGSQFGVMACLLVEVIQSYQMYRRPHMAVLKLVLPIMVLFILGLLPWFDNFAHIFGFFFGFLLAFALMPYVSFGKFDRHRKIISIVGCLGSAIALFVALVIIFYVAPLTECEICQYFNCIALQAGMCQDMQVSLKKNSTYSQIY